jgi:hypothetical protein
MTGSLLFNRQHSSTEGNSNVNPMIRQKLRRWSSADDRNSFEVIPDDDKQYKHELPRKCNESPSDSDSGVEDLDQQVGNFVSSQPNHVGEDEPSTDFGACEDENFEEHSQPIITERLEEPAQQVFGSIYDYRK